MGKVECEEQRKSWGLELFYMLVVVVTRVLYVSNLLNYTLKEMHATVCKLYLNKEKKNGMKGKAAQNCSPGALGTLPCLTTFLSGQGQCDLEWHLPMGLLPGDHLCPLHFSSCGHGPASLGSLAL